MKICSFKICGNKEVVKVKEIRTAWIAAIDSILKKRLNGEDRIAEYKVLGDMRGEEIIIKIKFKKGGKWHDTNLCPVESIFKIPVSDGFEADFINDIKSYLEVILS